MPLHKLYPIDTRLALRSELEAIINTITHEQANPGFIRSELIK
jgi:hypothetical protein